MKFPCVHGGKACVQRVCSVCAAVGASGPFVSSRLHLGCQCHGPQSGVAEQAACGPQSCRPGFISGKQEMHSSQSQRKVQDVSVSTWPGSNLAQPAISTGQSRELSPRQNPSFSEQWAQGCAVTPGDHFHLLRTGGFG